MDLKYKQLKENKSIFFILGIAAVFRVLLPVIAYIRNQNFSIFYSQDTNRYISLAKELLENQRFFYDGLPEIERVPGYPIFLLIGLKLDNIEIYTTILQIILSCFSVYLVFKIAIMIFQNVKFATASAALYSIEPMSILYSSKILTETLFTTFLLLFIYFLIRFTKEEKLIFLIFSALTLSVGVYIRPIGIFLNLLITIILSFYLIIYNKKSFLSLIKPMIFFLITLLLITPWQIRNFKTLGYYGFSTNGDSCLYFTAAFIYSSKEKISIYDMREIMFDKNIKKEIAPINSTSDERIKKRTKAYRLMRDEAIKIISHNYPTYLMLQLQNISRFFVNPGLTEYLRLFKFNYSKAREIIDSFPSIGTIGIVQKMLKEAPFLLLLYVLFSLVTIMYFTFALIGSFTYKSFNISFFIILTVIFYLTILSTIHPIGLSRYRQPIMPLICVLAGKGLITTLNKLRGHRAFS